MNHIITLYVLTLLFTCCSPRIKSDTYNGIWKSIGHGEILEIKGDEEFAFYDMTSISCVPRRKGSLDEINKSLSLHTDTLSLYVGAIRTRNIRASSLPILCLKPMDADKANDPLYNFEVFMETVKEHYAFLELNEINWDELYEYQKSKLGSNSNNADLYSIVEETLEKLNDNHGYLIASDEVYDLLEELYPEVEEPKDTLPALGDFHVSHTVAKHHLKEDMTRDSWLVYWGKIENNIGYIQLLAMNAFAKLTDLTVYDKGWHDAFNQARDEMYEAAYLEKEVEGVSQTMDVVMKDLSETESIIIDVRFNGGGHDVVSFEILSRFIKDKMQVASHKFRYGDRHTSIDPLYIHGSEKPYLKPVYVLTSPQTGSAAEVFSIATMALPHVTRIGSATEGAFSTTLDKSLPNGWEFAVSNEVYMDNDSKCYENIGIPVHYELNYLKDRQPFFRSVVNDLQKDKQNILVAVKVSEENSKRPLIKD